MNIAMKYLNNISKDDKNFKKHLQKLKWLDNELNKANK